MQLLLLATYLSPSTALRVLLFGASGNLGSRVLYQLTTCGHTVTAFVPSEQRLRAGFNDRKFDDVQVVEGDALDKAAVVAAMAGGGSPYDVVVSAAGSVDNDASSAEEAANTNFCRMFSNIADAAEEHLPAPRRALFVGGITVLDVPGTSTSLQSLLSSRFHYSQYEAHVINLSKLRDSKLEWTLLCPGYLVDAAPSGCAPVGCEPTDEPLRLTADVVPAFEPTRAFKPWQLTRALKYPFVLLPFLLRKGEWTVPYESVASVLVANLAAGGAFARTRVGLANPPGVKLQKTDAARTRERSKRERKST